MRKTIGLLLLGFMLGAALAQKGTVTIGSKNFTEQFILGEMMAQALEAQGFKVNRKFGLGGSTVAREALEAGELDMYPEYTGTAITVFFSKNAELQALAHDAEKGYELLKQVDAEENNLHWLCPAPANNTWALAVRRDFAEANNVFTHEDLARYLAEGGQVTLAANPEFVNRSDALEAFERTYGYKIPRENVRVLGQGSYVTAQAVANRAGGVNLGVVYGTDGTIGAFDLVVLKDTKGAQVVFRPTPVVRGELLEQHPEIEALLCRIFKTLDDATLARLNGRVDVDGERPEDVARDYLKELGILN
ncbi:ABC transporter substrate-binding protein [Marinithermus hydrothermalis]|uniref:ABC-type glycine betaine transport, periplasmic subunit n=1 Tax=Marinithermus hydrothermalis (strain DSM 14884 / JCM 11576 / T1) TaxID=869210 RepID=F2NPH1_MARHT|nr:ABC transporter substrate-binding protein [Marinithermus hydrothermalis]AEB12252.1 ABC-type glycine betaine transport, periplasmic subunit [Marinithermus hydrothermalis DSM 14884]